MKSALHDIKSLLAENYITVKKRRTVREFLDKDVDFEVVKRILKAGNQAPAWNHSRSWTYIILRTEEEKEYAFEYAKKIAVTPVSAPPALSRPSSPASPM